MEVTLWRMVHGLGTGCLKQMCTGARGWAGRSPGEGVRRGRDRGRRLCWEVGAEETNEISAFREPAAGWGRDSERALPCLPGGGGWGMNLGKVGLQGVVTCVCPGFNCVMEKSLFTFDIPCGTSS